MASRPTSNSGQNSSTAHADGANFAPRMARVLEWEGMLVARLESAGWRIERRDPSAPPRRMAQFAALEADGKRVILYVPFLRWIAANWGGPGALGPTLAGLAGAAQPTLAAILGALPESDRARCLESLALAHEYHHVLDEDVELCDADGERAGRDRSAILRVDADDERAATEYAAKVFEHVWAGVMPDDLSR